MKRKDNMSIQSSRTPNVKSTCLLPGYTEVVSIGLLVILIVSVVILACVPPVSRDALTHHLAVPKLYLQHGGIYEIPTTVFSYYPMNLDLLYLLSLYFGNDIAPKYIHFLFGLLTAALIFGYLRKRLGIEWGLFGTLFFLSLPLIVKLSITVYVDLGLVFFSTAALICLLKWIENRFQVKFLIVSAVCCGLALGTKYNGLIVLFILTLFVPFVFISGCRKWSQSKNSAHDATSIKIQLKAVGFGAIFFLTGLLVFSPWMIRNYAWKSNPIYPLYDGVFNRRIQEPADAQTGGRTHGSDADLQQTSTAKSTPWSPFAIRKVIYGESWWEIALIPVRIFFQGQDDNPKYFDGQLNPFLFFLPFFAFIHLRKNAALLQTEKKIFLFFIIIFFLYAFSMTVIRIRYIAPAVPPLVILATLGLHQITRIITERQPTKTLRIGSSFCIVLATTILALNASYVLKQFRYVDPFSYISGRMSRDAYIAKYRPEYAVYQYANEHLSAHVKILGLFLGNRMYYCDRAIIFGVDEFKKIVRGAASEEILLSDLRKKGYTHGIIRYDLFNRWANKQFDDGQKQILKKFFDSEVEYIFSQAGYGLLKLNDMHYLRKADSH